MLSTISLHPFISHFPTALLVAGLFLLFLSRKRNNAKLSQAASFNFSMGFLAALMAVFSGLFSSDIGLRTNVEIEGHQGYSLLFTVLYGFCTVYSYVKAFTTTAFIFYGLTFLAMCATAYSGYLLVFYSTG